jgi:DNA modification methylase
MQIFSNDEAARPLRVELWAIERLAPYPGQLKRNDHAVDRLIASIQSYGFKIPLLVSPLGEIIDGALRCKAARKLGFAELPVIVCEGWTAEQIRGFRLMANRSASWAEWDLEAVAKELAELHAKNFDVSLSGFEALEVEELLAPRRDEQSLDATVPNPAMPVSRTGDLWICGRHRVLCADSRDGASVSQLCGSVSPVLMVTDPPYGVNYDPSWREQAGLGAQRQTGKVPNDDRVDWSDAFRLFAGDVAYVWHAGLFAQQVAMSLEQCGFEMRSQIIWAKQHFALSRGHYHWQHEPCWYAVRQGGSGHWCGDRKQSTLWEISNLNAFGGDRGVDAVTGHGTQKPVELMRRPLLNHTRRGDIVYDPFLGSGSTLMAAEDTGRTCYGLEIDPGYVDAILLRWQKLTGGSALLEGAGLSFAELRAARQGGVAMEGREEIDVAA